MLLFGTNLQVSMVSLSHLYACMAAQIEIKLCGMSDAGINCCTCWYVSTLTNLPHTNHCNGYILYLPFVL